MDRELSILNKVSNAPKKAAAPLTAGGDGQVGGDVVEKVVVSQVVVRFGRGWGKEYDFIVGTY